MSNKRLSGQKNYLYLATLGNEISGDGATPLAAEGYYKITAVKASGSAWPTNAVVGTVVYNKPAITPETGDDCKLFTLTKAGFVNDVPNSATKEDYEDTVQTDDAKSWEEGDRPEISGTLQGYLVHGDAVIDELLARYFEVQEDDGAGSRTITAPQTGVIHFFLGRNETTVVGEVEWMQYLPVIISGQISLDKPMQGKQAVSVPYKVIGSERPTLFKRTITA